MRILYDHQMFSRQKYGGITKYFCELIKNLPGENEYQLSLLFSNNQHLKDEHSFFKKFYLPMPKQDTRFKGQLKAKSYSLNEYYSKYLISKGKFDLFHPTYFDPYFLNIIGKPYIVTVHDLIVFHYPGVNRKEEQMEEMAKIIKGASRIIAISENTKQEVISTLNIHPGKIDVVYHGFNRIDTTNAPNNNGRYILFVGARPGYKNFKNLALAFKKLLAKDKELKLICTGNPFSEKEMKELANLNISKNVIVMGVNETKLNELYSHALAFVNPSLYEGFGMTILEAFANNCPVCLSNSSCFPEIARDAGTYFDPQNPDSISEAIEKNIYDSDYSERMVIKGNNRLQSFSWIKCGIETMDSYKKALS